MKAQIKFIKSVELISQLFW